ncbi:MAG: type II secretion system F family protein [Eubacteriales bacterium]|nr:type II secretion system F family protein [Eubacteriales bacterium]
MKFKPTREQLLCILVGFFFALILFLKQDRGTVTELKRPGYGEEAKVYELIVKDENGRDTEVSLTVSGMAYSEERLREIYPEIAGMIPELIKGENESLSHVTRPLNLIFGTEMYPGISIKYKSGDPTVLGSDGKIGELTDYDEHPLYLSVTLSNGGYEETYDFPVTVIRDDGAASPKSFMERISDMAGEIDTLTISDDTYILPIELDGQRLRFKYKTDLSPLIMIALGVAAAVMLMLKPREDEKKRKKERENELLLDYSELVSKLLIYIGAGLTIRNAFERIGGEGDGRALYEEINILNRNLSNAIPEGEAYMQFARSCGPRCYIRLASILEQNRKTGDSSVIAALELEMEEAFEQRKNTAKRLGEEAGTKLLLPLMISLVTVMVIVVIPAIMKMN